MRWLRELFSDFLLATGAAIVIFSLGTVILILVTAVPAGNPYIAFFTFILLPAFTMVGGLVFLFGVLLGRKKGQREKPGPSEPGPEDAEPE
ncbi:MAG: hypothetical protein HY676_00685 [Chloroflexi bacterium]|nr:hypothetical protein [Chloroflexota bacterium]